MAENSLPPSLLCLLRSMSRRVRRPHPSGGCSIPPLAEAMEVEGAAGGPQAMDTNNVA